MFDGLKDSVVKLSWDDNRQHETLRYVIHIADAPPHGTEYCKTDRAFPGGCPAGITLQELGRLFYQNNIRYRLFKVRSFGNDSLATMEKKFQAMFHDMKSVDINNADQMKIEVSKGLIQEVMFTKE